MLTRRDFLTKSSLIALAPSVPTFLAQTARAAEPQRDDRVLVVLQLAGGNDGINTVVPYADEGYARNRKKLRLPTDQVMKLNDQVGLHPAMRGAAELVESGRLAIVQGVGYPNPNRSHDVSMKIWQTARFDPEEHKTYGWIGRAMDHAPALDGSPSTVMLGNEDPPITIRGRRSVTVALAHLNDLKLNSKVFRPRAAQNSQDTDVAAFVRRSALDAYDASEQFEKIAKRTSGGDAYPATQLATRMKMMAQLIKAGFGTRVYYALQDGYDTHYAQLPSQDRLLRELSGALKAFLDDLKAAGLDDRVVVMTFSEFGRSVKENASLGTDHGTAGPVFVAGAPVNSCLVGATPSMTDLENGDLKTQFDFRQVYATLLEDWVGVNSAKVLGGSFDRLKLIAST